MSYKVFSFKADQNNERCMEYSSNYMQVLSEYGCRSFKAFKEPWMEHNDVYVIALHDDNNRMIGGIRLHLSKNGVALPVEDSVLGMEKITYIMKSGANKLMGEICGLWVNKDHRQEELEAILCQAATVLAYRRGATSLLTHIEPQCYELYKDLGFFKVAGVGRSGDFLDPAFDYSIVMLLPNVETMEYASIIQRAGMLSLRENPVQTFVMNPANFLFINYQLDKVIENETVNKEIAVFA